MIERKIDAQPHDDAREHEHDEQDGCIKAGNLRRDFHAPERAAQIKAVQDGLTL